MKKCLILVLCTILLLSSFAFANAAQQPQESGQTTNAVDIVLLIDQSGSVWRNNPTDPEGYRLDAASMVVGMLSMGNGSRVAFVPFASRVFENADNEFHEINKSTDYFTIKNKCDLLRIPENAGGPNDEYRGGTDYAEPLAYAYNLLANREDKSNQPMIILLTDGMMDLSNNENDQKYAIKPFYYEWNDKTQRFEETDRKVTEGDVHVYVDYAENLDRNKKKRSAKKLQETAVIKCGEQGYPIYTVAITTPNNKSHVDELRKISQQTGVDDVVPIQGGEGSTDLAKLPVAFGNMLANQIGVSEVKGLKAKPVPGEPGVYEVELEIPNRSVKEVNLFVPLKGIEDEKLYGPDGNIAPAVSYFSFKTDNYLLYKVTDPQNTGPWKLRFKVNADEDVNVDDITFNVLYNYDVVLEGQVDVKNTHPSPDDTFKRSQTLHFTGRFFDNARNGYSSEQELYQYPLDESRPVDDWYRIKATYVLENDLGGVVKEGNLDVDLNNLMFYVDMDMKTRSTDSDGYNTLAPGNYVLIMNVTGSGLERTTEIPFVLENTSPSEGQGLIDLKREVNGPNADQQVATDETIELATHVNDADNDRLMVTYKKTSGDSLLRFNSTTLQFTSRPRTDASRHPIAGYEEGELEISDGYVITTLPVQFSIINLSDELAQQLEMRVTVGGQETGYIAEKNSTVTLKLELLDNTGMPAPSTTIDKITAVEFNYTLKDNSTHIGGTMQKDPNANNVYIATLDTNSMENEWKISVDIKQANITIKNGRTDFKVENHAPQATVTAPQTLTIYYNPLPDFLSFLATATPEEERTLDMYSYFSEQDNETLTYQLVQQNDTAAVLITENNDGTQWLLTAVDGASGKTQFSIQAIDNDGEATNEVLFEIELIDLTAMWITRGMYALAALVALIILILIIRQIRKPKFPRGASLGVREGNSDYDTSTYEFVPGKKPISLAAIVMTDTASKFGISANALTNVILTPVRSINGSIGVRLNKRMDDVMVSLGTQAVTKSKKPVKWNPGDILQLSGRTNTTGSELNILLYAPDVPNLPSPVMNDDPFGMGALQNDGFGSGSDAFGPNDVNGSWAGLTHTDTFSTASKAEDSSFSLPDSDSNSSAPADFFSSDNNNSDDFSGGF